MLVCESYFLLSNRHWHSSRETRSRCYIGLKGMRVRESEREKGSGLLTLRESRVVMVRERESGYGEGERVVMVRERVVMVREREREWL